MDKVKKFDEELKIIYKDNVFFQKVLSILFFGLRDRKSTRLNSSH